MLNNFAWKPGQAGDPNRKFSVFVRDILTGERNDYEEGNSGPKWWQDVYAEALVDRTLGHPAEDRRQGRLWVRRMDGTLDTIRHRARPTPDENDIDTTMKDLLRDADNLGQISVRRMEDFIQHLNDRWHQNREGEENLWRLRRSYLENVEEIIQYAS